MNRTERLDVLRDLTKLAIVAASARSTQQGPTLQDTQGMPGGTQGPIAQSQQVLPNKNENIKGLNLIARPKTGRNTARKKVVGGMGTGMPKISSAKKDMLKRVLLEKLAEKKTNPLGFALGKALQHGKKWAPKPPAPARVPVPTQRLGASNPLSALHTPARVRPPAPKAPRAPRNVVQPHVGKAKWRNFKEGIRESFKSKADRQAAQIARTEQQVLRSQADAVGNVPGMTPRFFTRRKNMPGMDQMPNVLKHQQTGKVITTAGGKQFKTTGKGKVFKPGQHVDDVAATPGKSGSYTQNFFVPKGGEKAVQRAYAKGQRNTLFNESAGAWGRRVGDAARLTRDGVVGTVKRIPYAMGTGAAGGALVAGGMHQWKHPGSTQDLADTMGTGALEGSGLAYLGEKMGIGPYTKKNQQKFWEPTANKIVGAGYLDDGSINPASTDAAKKELNLPGDVDYLQRQFGPKGWDAANEAKKRVGSNVRYTKGWQRTTAAAAPMTDKERANIDAGTAEASRIFGAIKKRNQKLQREGVERIQKRQGAKALQNQKNLENQ